MLKLDELVLRFSKKYELPTEDCRSRITVLPSGNFLVVDPTDAMLDDFVGGDRMHGICISNGKSYWDQEAGSQRWGSMDAEYPKLYKSLKTAAGKSDKATKSDAEAPIMPEPPWRPMIWIHAEVESMIPLERFVLMSGGRFPGSMRR